MLSRLPFLLVALAGLWLWRSGDTPRERSVYVQLGGRGAGQVRTLEAQFTSPEGELQQRTQHFFQGPPPPEVRLEVRLPEGAHPVLLFLKDAEGQPFPVQRTTLDVTEADAYALPVTVPARPSPGR